MVSDGADAATINTMATEFCNGSKRVVICTPKNAAQFVEDGISEVYLMNLKPAGKRALEALVNQLCRLRPSKDINATAMFDRDDKPMAKWTRSVLEGSSAVIMTPLWTIDQALALPQRR